MSLMIEILQCRLSNSRDQLLIFPKFIESWVISRKIILRNPYLLIISFSIIIINLEKRLNTYKIITNSVSPS